MTPLRFLAVSGSLRARSSNTELLRAAALLAPPAVAVALYDELAAVPPFNPDLDEEGAVAPAVVRRLRDAVVAADALLLSSPEYAHGIPGALKNALDWLVSEPRLAGKPVALLNASARSTYAHGAWLEILRTMSTTLVPPTGAVIPLDGRRIDAAAIVADAELAHLLREALAAVAAVVRSG